MHCLLCLSLSLSIIFSIPGASDAQALAGIVHLDDPHPEPDLLMPPLHTLVVAPSECHCHRTCPEPITRSGSEVPSENVNRLKVLTDPGMFSLPDHLFSCARSAQHSAVVHGAACCANNAQKPLLHSHVSSISTQKLFLHPWACKAAL